MHYIGTPAPFKSPYGLPVRSGVSWATLWHLFPKPIAQLQTDNGSYQDGRCWYWIEA